MLSEIQVRNYKSITALPFSLGRVNVLIGENGAGKSNILEAIALAGAAAAEKLDNEFLVSRGIRVTRPEDMRPGFPAAKPQAPISISFSDDNGASGSFDIQNDNAPYSKWTATYAQDQLNVNVAALKNIIDDFVLEAKENKKSFDALKEFINLMVDSHAKATESKEDHVSDGKPIGDQPLSVGFQLSADNEFTQYLVSLKRRNPQLAKYLGEFVIFSPENSSLREFYKEGQIEPLGVNGEGVLKLLSVYADADDSTILESVKTSLKVLGWFEDFKLVSDSNRNRIEIQDLYLQEGAKYYDHHSTNEGFLFLLFYFLLFTSELTPQFFAIDNIDASLNPKLCQKLIQELVRLAKKNNKQVILTTHNPAILDGLNLNDDEQRLFIVSRSRKGDTKLKRFVKPAMTAGETRLKLSEMFLDGALGGLPKGF